MKNLNTNVCLQQFCRNVYMLLLLSGWLIQTNWAYIWGDGRVWEEVSLLYRCTFHSQHAVHSLGKTEACSQDVDCTVTLLTLWQSSSQVFIFLLLLVPMNLINTCKENIGTFLAASAPLSPGSAEAACLTWPVSCDVLAEGYDPLKVTNEGHLGTIRPGLWRRVIARIRHHLQTKFTTNVHTTTNSRSQSSLIFIPVPVYLHSSQQVFWFVGVGFWWSHSDVVIYLLLFWLVSKKSALIKYILEDFRSFLIFDDNVK